MSKTSGYHENGGLSNKYFENFERPKNAICLWLKLRMLNNADLNIVHFFLVSAKPNCVFMTFKVEESFWTKKQSCKSSKVDKTKWRPFFFVLTDTIF